MEIITGLIFVANKFNKRNKIFTFKHEVHVGKTQEQVYDEET